MDCCSSKQGHDGSSTHSPGINFWLVLGAIVVVVVIIGLLR